MINHTIRKFMANLHDADKWWAGRHLVERRVCQRLELGEGTLVGLPRHDTLPSAGQAGEGLHQLNHRPAIRDVLGCLMRLQTQIQSGAASRDLNAVTKQSSSLTISCRIGWHQ